MSANPATLPAVPDLVPAEQPGPTDWWHKLAEFIDYNRYLFMALMIIAVGSVTLAMGTPRAMSPISGQKVTESELIAEAGAKAVDIQAEIDAIRAKAEADIAARAKLAEALSIVVESKIEDLQARQAAIEQVLGTIGSLATTAAGPVFGPIVSTGIGVAGLLLGVGVKADAARKDNVIARLKATK